MAYVRTIPYIEAEGELKEIYDQLIADRGRIGNVMAVNSLRPHIMKSLMIHINQVQFSPSGLTQAEKQMIATLVSALNKCQY